MNVTFIVNCGGEVLQLQAPSRDMLCAARIGGEKKIHFVGQGMKEIHSRAYASQGICIASV